MLILSAGILIFVGILFIRTCFFVNEPHEIEIIDLEEIDPNQAADRLSQAIQLKTISHENGTIVDEPPFLAFHGLLERLFPAVHGTLKREVINGCSLLYKWQGKNPQLQPIAFLAHMDVVPVESGTETDWQFAPFSAEIADGSHTWDQ